MNNSICSYASIITLVENARLKFHIEICANIVLDLFSFQSRFYISTIYGGRLGNMSPRLACAYGMNRIHEIGS